MAGNSGSIQEAATVGGYELGVGSKPRELLFVANGFIPLSAQTGGYVSPSGAIVAGLASFRITTAGDHNANAAVSVTPVAQTSITVDGETLSYSAPAGTVTTSGSSGDAGATSATANSTPGQLIVHNGNAAVAATFTVDLNEVDAAGTMLPLISSCSFGAGSLVMGPDADTIHGAFVFGSGQDGGDLNILDATVQMTVDAGGNDASTNTLEDLTLGNMTDTAAGAMAMNCVVTGVSGGTVHFVAQSGHGDYATDAAGGDFYRLSIRALAHPKGGI